MYPVVIPKLCSLSKQIVRTNNLIRNFTSIPASSTELCKYCDYNLTSFRYKSKSKKLDKKVESESEEETEHDLDEEIIDKNTKVLNVRVNSLRVDGLLKLGIGMARNKIETLFYESKIRVNGKKLFKKSEAVNPGDEIDIIKGISAENPKLLVVARVEVLSADEKGEKVAVKLRRTKSLIIENYNEPWKGNTTGS